MSGISLVREKEITQIYDMQPQEAELEPEDEYRKEAGLSLILENIF